MRPFRATLTVLALLLMSLAVAGPATAGGPTSVLLAAPDTGTAASLYFTDTEYEALASQVGVNQGSGVAGTVDQSGATHEFGSQVTLTWLIHDVMVWRVDRVFLDAEGGPWISTQANVTEAGNIWDSPVVWHTAADGVALTALLDELGLGHDGKGAAAVTEGKAPAAAPAVAPQPAAAAVGDNGGSATRGWVWGLAGLALGAVLAVAATCLPTLRSAPVGPRAAALAAEGPFDPVASVESDDARDWSVPDELASPSRYGARGMSV